MSALSHDRRSSDDLKEPAFGQAIDRLIDVARIADGPRQGEAETGEDHLVGFHLVEDRMDLRQGHRIPVPRRQQDHPRNDVLDPWGPVHHRSGGLLGKSPGEGLRLFGPHAGCSQDIPYPVWRLYVLTDGDRLPGALPPGYALFCSGRARSPSFGMGFPFAINRSNR